MSAVAVAAVDGVVAVGGVVVAVDGWVAVVVVDVGKKTF